MRRNGYTLSPFFYILSILLFLAAFIIGCSEDLETPTAPDALSDTRLLPKPVRTVNPGIDSTVEVQASYVEMDFPDSLTFHLEAESTHTITDIQLLYTTIKLFRPSVTVTIRPEFDPSTYVRVNWAWDTRKFSLPTGTNIEYWWAISTSDEDTFETESVRTIFEDDRFFWKDLETKDIHLFWYEEDASFGQELMEAARQALTKLSEDANSELAEQVDIYIYGSSEELRSALIYPDEWTGGMAFPDYGIIVIGVAPHNLEWGKRAVTHELSHMVVYQVTYSPLSNVPTWLDEGIAMYAEGDLTRNFERSLENAISDDELFSIRGISGGFPSDTDKAELAYAQSYSLVKLLIDSYGSTEIQDLLQAFSQGINIDDALLKVYGFDSTQLEAIWLDSVS